MPEAVRVSYLKYLAGNTSEECVKAKKIVADRERLFDPLELMDWAELPSVELSPEQAEKNNRRAREFSEKNPYIELMKNFARKMRLNAHSEFVTTTRRDDECATLAVRFMWMRIRLRLVSPELWSSGIVAGGIIFAEKLVSNWKENWCC